MQRRIVWTAATLATAAIGFFSSSAPENAPLPGPGGVIDAVQRFVAAVDAGDADYLESAFADVGPGGLYGFDDGGKIAHLESAGKMVFYDVAASGDTIRVTDPKAAVARIAADIGGAERGLKTVIRSIRADCPSERCSYAVVEFDRTFEEGEQKVTVPMQASVLVRFGEGKPDFRIFHWHASRARGSAASR